MADQPDQDQPAPEQAPLRPSGPRVSRNWHETRATPEGKKIQAKSQKRKTIFILLACILALLGVIGAWLFFIHPFHPPQLVAIALTEYPSHNFPFNAFAKRDSTALRAHFKAVTHADDSQEKRLLEEKLEDLRKKSDTPVVVHLCGFSRVYNGTLYLIPAGRVQPNDPSTWLKMDDVLRPLRECKADHKLLILDIYRTLDDPRRGTLPDDIAGAFQDLFKSKKQGKLLVLCACSPGQTSLLSEELSRSVFGYYLDQGLGGFADCYNKDRQTDKRISVRELAAFVRARVERWARRNRGLSQTPVLLGDAPDFDLVAMEGDEAAAKLEDEPLPAYPAQIRAGWKVRDEWLADRSYE